MSMEAEFLFKYLKPLAKNNVQNNVSRLKQTQKNLQIHG